MNRPMRLAVIDLGTNTFHLLVVEVFSGQWKFLLRKRIFVNLAESGIHHIGDAALARAHAALETFRQMLDAEQIGIIRAVGTAALRRADNAGAFLAEVSRRTRINVEIVSGEKEAEWIAKGVLAALPATPAPLLIMDIGGGSVELILTQNGTTLFSRSYPIGVAVLYRQFHDTEPISQDALERMDAFLGDALRGLLHQLQSYPECVLVGASGTFEVIDAIVSGTSSSSPYSTFDSNDFGKVYGDILGQDLPARLTNALIPESRARYIVVAMHLVAFVLSHLKHSRAYISAYAMKEGIVEDVLHDLD